MNNIQKNSDIILAFGLLLMIGLMLIPLPTFMLDFFLAINITLSVLVFVLALYIKSPLDISVFPGLLLMLTLFRLALNISSSRLILIEGYAGEVIESFGTFVIGVNYVVGFIIFLILVIIQFIVIIKGSMRISEVAARFTLDAMPGKQMAIDADLNTGLINESEARQRRDLIAREAEFFGSMDGASKFVKGDAVAGLIINMINIVAGFIIGVAQKGMPFTEALQNYTVLTIGDGLVTQIPALIISTSAGLIVTRSSSGGALDFEMKTQLLSNPRVLGTVGGMVLLFALVPGMPTIPFLLIGVVLGTGSYLKNKAKKEALAVQAGQEVIKAEEPKEEKVEQYLQVDPIEIEIGYGLITLVDEKQGGELFKKIASTRKYIALEYGVLVPSVRVRDNLQLDPNEYIIKIKGNVVANYVIHTDRYLAMNPGGIEEALQGIPTEDPAFKMPAFWIAKEEKDRADLLGFTVVDAMSVLSTHLQETLRHNFDKILSRQAVKKLIENLKSEYPAVVDEINTDVLSLGTIQKVLQNLLREFIPIKDMVQILESLIDYARVTKNVDVLTEYARHSIGDTIANLYKDLHGVIHAAVLSEEIEGVITRSLQEQKEAVHTLGLSPDKLRALNNGITKSVGKFKNFGYLPIVITSATIRPYFYRLINSSFKDVVVLSYSELPSEAELEFIDKIEAIK